MVLSCICQTKSICMLSQQMKSHDCLLEDSDLQLSLTPNNLVAINNF